MKHLGVTGTFGYRGQRDNDVKKNSKILDFVFKRVPRTDPKTSLPVVIHISTIDQ